MGQLFRAYTNTVSRYVVFGGLPLLVLLYTLALKLDWSEWQTGARQAVVQPVPFSHEHHVGGLGIDCRYCHTSVEASASAGMPPTHTCMSCHSQLYTDAAALAPVRASYRDGRPLHWQRVYRLPDYVYFDHQAHTLHGVGCESCHGRVDRMPLVYQAVSLHMTFCLDCHRDPARFLRPPEAVYAFGYALSEKEQRATGQRLVRQYRIDAARLADCSVCHR